MPENALVELGNGPSLGLLETHVTNFLRHLGLLATLRGLCARKE
jgi:hypothetical protein